MGQKVYTQFKKKKSLSRRVLHQKVYTESLSRTSPPPKGTCAFKLKSYEIRTPHQSSTKRYMRIQVNVVRSDCTHSKKAVRSDCTHQRKPCEVTVRIQESRTK